MAKTNRPTGIAVLAILYILGGIATIILGLAAGTILTAFLGASILGGLASVFAAFFVILGLICLVVGYGLWKGMKWAWWLTVILSALGILFGLISLLGSPISGVISIIVDAIIIYYMTRKATKAYFRV